MRSIKIIFLLFFFLSSAQIFAHPEDELIIREIEEGQLSFQDDQMTAEYEAALKRQRLRKLNAMSGSKQFFLFVKAGI